MKRTLIGNLETLWSYPVKSMQGEELGASAISTKGLLGDRFLIPKNGIIGS